MTSGISRYTLGAKNTSAIDDVYFKGKEIYIDPTPPPASGIIENTIDLIWADTYDGNLNWTTATSSSLGQYDSGDPYTPPFEIGTSSYPVPTANMWIEVELEGVDTSCSETINQATNTRVELGVYKGWWKDEGGNWHEMTKNNISGGRVPSSYDLIDGLRGCEQQVFVDAREAGVATIPDTIVEPGRSNDIWSSTQHITVKPEHYFRWHGWMERTIFDTETTCKAIVWQRYARLVVEDITLPDDRHLARYVIHSGCDRKEYDGTQLWNIEIGRFKRVTNDWQPFNLSNGIMSKDELIANPPPFDSIP